MERRRISIFESFLSGGSVGKRARKVQKAALNAWRINYVIVDILSTLSLKVNTFIQAKEDVVGLDWTPMIRILTLLPALPQSKGPSNKIYIFFRHQTKDNHLNSEPLPCGVSHSVLWARATLPPFVFARELQVAAILCWGSLPEICLTMLLASLWRCSWCHSSIG